MAFLRALPQDHPKRPGQFGKCALSLCMDIFDLRLANVGGDRRLLLDHFPMQIVTWAKSNFYLILFSWLFFFLSPGALM